MLRKLKTSAIVLVASLMLLVSFGLSAQPAMAATSKEIYVKCSSLSYPNNSNEIQVFGTDSNGQQQNHTWTVTWSLSEGYHIHPDGWLWQGYVNLLFSYDGGYSWINKGQHQLTGGWFSDTWDRIDISC